TEYFEKLHRDRPKGRFIAMWNSHPRSFLLVAIITAGGSLVFYDYTNYLQKFIVITGWFFFFFSSRRRHTRFDCDWSSDGALPICLRLQPRELDAPRQSPPDRGRDGRAQRRFARRSHALPARGEPRQGRDPAYRRSD